MEMDGLVVSKLMETDVTPILEAHAQRDLDCFIPHLRDLTAAYPNLTWYRVNDFMQLRERGFAVMACFHRYQHFDTGALVLGGFCIDDNGRVTYGEAEAQHFQAVDFPHR